MRRITGGVGKSYAFVKTQGREISGKTCCFLVKKSVKV